MPLLNTPEPAAEPHEGPDMSELRAAVIGNRKSRKQLAKAFDCCERSIDNLAGKYGISYVRVLGERYFDPADFRRALEAEASGRTAPRGRGRPRKAA
jgi:hypothetical protein